MARVDKLPIYDAPWDSESALDVSASHLDSSGFPWQEGSNVYISGHRMGFPGTKSFLVFYDLDVLEEGDEVILKDSEGTKYSYKVFTKYVADPYDWEPTESVEGKSVVTLQTCTLPDYTQRLIVQAELTDVEQGQEATSTQEPEAAPAWLPAQGEPEQNDLAPTEPVQGGEPVPVKPVPGEPGQAEPVQEVAPVPVEPVQSG
jgi:LPXTG-site transpeptidase (sortase) family protein